MKTYLKEHKWNFCILLILFFIFAVLILVLCSTKVNVYKTVLITTEGDDLYLYNFNIDNQKLDTCYVSFVYDNEFYKFNIDISNQDHSDVLIKSDELKLFVNENNIRQIQVNLLIDQTLFIKYVLGSI
ncbi:hypothetical protein NPA13_01615 [Mycoplasma sp. 2045]|uniref:MAG1140 family protein n=1 Tax=Mycoplasma sp. 2045 TaxID=2967301 RepID=UPI00211C6AA2|nr:hypothetical protein [Mycoplasma sp. 2045]UUM20694.1 hypothetical protein NPA13_01615 [Mycoplasma sp. 2045]